VQGRSDLFYHLGLILTTSDDLLIFVLICCRQKWYQF